MANEKLKAQVWTIDDGEIVTATDSPQIIDDSLGDDNPTYYVFDWKTNSSAIFWSSDVDDPSGDVTHRSKAAVINWNPIKSTGMTQESWDVAINMPPPEDELRVIPSRLGQSNDFVIAGGGGTATAPTAFDQITGALYNTWTDLEGHTDWPQNDEEPFATHPSHGYNFDISPSVAMGPDGKVWFSHTELGSIEYDSQSQTSIYDTIQDFIDGNISSSELLTPVTLRNGASAIWVHPTTGEVYKFTTALNQTSGVPPFISSTDGPVTYVGKWNGVNFTRISTIQSPELGGSGWDGLPAERSWVDSDPTGDLVRFSDNTAIFIGQPYLISENKWILSAPAYIQRGRERYIAQGIWQTTDAGNSWTRIALFRPGRWVIDSFVYIDEQFTAFSRNIVKFKNKFWVAFALPSSSWSSPQLADGFSWGIAPFIGLPGGGPESPRPNVRPATDNALLFCSEDGVHWDYASQLNTNNAITQSIELYTGQNQAGEETLFILEGGNRLHSITTDPTGLLDLSEVIAELRIYTDLADNQTHANMITKLGGTDTVAILTGPRGFVCDTIDLDFHSGVSAYIVDQCSS
jgi:hypothetical protein